MTNSEFKAFTKGKFFGVKFIKADGSVREYKGCRCEVSKFTNGGSNPVEHKSNLVTVYTPNEQRHYSTLNLKNVVEFTFQGEKQVF